MEAVRFQNVVIIVNYGDDGKCPQCQTYYSCETTNKNFYVPTVCVTSKFCPIKLHKT